mgnify:FL=1
MLYYKMLPENLCLFCKRCYKKDEDNVELVKNNKYNSKLENEVQKTREIIDDFELIDKDIITKRFPS